MKHLLIAFALSAFAASAHAAPDFQNLTGELFSSGLDAATSFAADPAEPKPPESMPIRMAQVRAVISKSTFVTKADGSMDVETKPVCTISATLSVYDARDGKPLRLPQSDYVRATCRVKVGGKMTTMRLGGVIGISNMKVIDTTETVKTVASSLWITGAGAIPGVNTMWSVSATKNINDSSFIQILRPDISVECKEASSGKPECKPSLNEYFHAIVDIEDK